MDRIIEYTEERIKDIGNGLRISFKSFNFGCIYAFNEVLIFINKIRSEDAEGIKKQLEQQELKIAQLRLENTSKLKEEQE